MDFLKRTWCQINVENIGHNYRQLKALVGPNVKVMGVVKADAYGHGVEWVVRELAEQGAGYFAVSNLEEALQIRELGFYNPVLIFGYTPTHMAQVLARNNITQTAISLDYARRLSARAEEHHVKVKIHVKIDTGMARVGLQCYREEDIGPVCDQAEQMVRLPGLEAEGIFTHFADADADDDKGFTRRQFNHYKGVVDELERRGVTFALRHCCNSAATLLYPEMHLDMVRPGIAMYGLYPSDPVARAVKLDLRPVMELKTVISLIKEIPAGTTVSYGRIYTAENPSAIATVPIGYADGFPRSLSNRAYVLVDGQRAPVVGRVCMDQMMVDITGIGGVKESDVVTVFGDDKGARLPVEEFAALSGTINYETVCIIGKRVPRVYFRDGKAIGRMGLLENRPGI